MANSEKESNEIYLQKSLAKLEEIAKYFEQTNIDLDTGIKMYEEGMKLAQEIKNQVMSYELKIKEIKEKYSGEAE